MLVTTKGMYQRALQNDFAVGAFNLGGSQFVGAILAAAEELQSPVILSIHPEELSHLQPPFVAFVRQAAIEASVPVAIHLDHGGSLDDVARALRLGYTSVMFDGSSLPYEENVHRTRAAVELAHSVGVPVEGELGTIGDASDLTIEAGVEQRQSLYTDPDLAVDFVERTGVDSLAVAIGTAHGMYPASLRPKLQLDLLAQISSLVRIPLVLHGGSDNTDEEVRRALSLGICKVNISSEMKRAFFQSLRKVLAAEPEAYEPTRLFPEPIAAAHELVKRKMRLFNSAGQAGVGPASPGDQQSTSWQPAEAVAASAV